MWSVVDVQGLRQLRDISRREAILGSRDVCSLIINGNSALKSLRPRLNMMEAEAGELLEGRQHGQQSETTSLREKQKNNPRTEPCVTFHPGHVDSQASALRFILSRVITL